MQSEHGPLHNSVSTFAPLSTPGLSFKPGGSPAIEIKLKNSKLLLKL